MGSSPLARGLREESAHGAPHGGIIPARAGFTPALIPLGALSKDHPRSRGVYPLPSLRYWSRAGSSPLARGLPKRLRRRTAASRIIPARAGFTRRPAWPPPRRGDHPRSRGVYILGLGDDRLRTGSSPLARGLPTPTEKNASVKGIIPARAGFTPARVLTISEVAGSSPLARGLHGRLIIPASRRRIIPARAGFTRSPRARRSWATDHPRSRGVYSAGTRCVPTTSGSSPLARGLRRA